VETLSLYPYVGASSEQLMDVSSSPVPCKGNSQVLIAAWKAEQLPNPVKNEKKQSANTLIDPTPPSYATFIG